MSRFHTIKNIRASYYYYYYLVSSTRQDRIKCMACCL